VLKKALETGISLSITAPVVEPGGGSFSGIYERQMEGSENEASPVNLIWALFWTQIMLGA